MSNNSYHCDSVTLFYNKFSYKIAYSIAKYPDSQDNVAAFEMLNSSHSLYTKYLIFLYKFHFECISHEILKYSCFYLMGKMVEIYSMYATNMFKAI